MRNSIKRDGYSSGDDRKRWCRRDILDTHESIPEDVTRFQSPYTSETSYGPPHLGAHCNNYYDLEGHLPSFNTAGDGVYSQSANAVNSRYDVGDNSYSSWKPLAFADGIPHPGALPSNGISPYICPSGYESVPQARSIYGNTNEDIQDQSGFEIDISKSLQQTVLSSQDSSSCPSWSVDRDRGETSSQSAYSDDSFDCSLPSHRYHQLDTNTVGNKAGSKGKDRYPNQHGGKSKHRDTRKHSTHNESTCTGDPFEHDLPRHILGDTDSHENVTQDQFTFSSSPLDQPPQGSFVDYHNLSPNAAFLPTPNYPFSSPASYVSPPPLSPTWGFSPRPKDHPTAPLAFGHSSPNAGKKSVQYNSPKASEIVTQHTFAYETKARTVLKILANGSLVTVLPDTGVTGNVMTKEHAGSLGVDVDSSKQRWFQNAVLTRFQSIGFAVLDLSFPDDPKRTWRCEFDIVTECAAPMVIGHAFLSQANVFTRWRRHLTKAALRVTRSLGGMIRKFWRLMLMEPSRRMLRCDVDGLSTLADADSGSDVDLVSLDYAERRMWDITHLPPDEGFVVLANGDLTRVLGYVDTVITIQGKSAQKRCYVLEGLACSVILGVDTIEEFQVFELRGVFEDVADPGANEAFRGIQWVNRYGDLEKEVDQLIAADASQSAPPKDRKKRNKKYYRGMQCFYPRRTGRTNSTACRFATSA